MKNPINPMFGTSLSLSEKMWAIIPTPLELF